MPLAQLDLEGMNGLERTIARLKQFQPPEGYYLAFSGGKDSIVLQDVAVEAKVKFDAHYHLEVDPPELVQFVRQNYPRVHLDHPPRNFWREIEQCGLPIRHRRWCCELFKEWGGAERVVLTGVRWAESARRRAKRRIVEEGSFLRTRYALPPRFLVNPIVDWSDEDVWAHIKSRKLPYCGLYDEGWKRLGCVMCPMTGKAQTLREMERWPNMAKLWRRASDRLFEAKGDTLRVIHSADELWEWWLNRGEKDGEEVAEEQCMMFQ